MLDAKTDTFLGHGSIQKAKLIKWATHTFAYSSPNNKFYYTNRYELICYSYKLYMVLSRLNKIFIFLWKDLFDLLFYVIFGISSIHWGERGVANVEYNSAFLI